MEVIKGTAVEKGLREIYKEALKRIEESIGYAIELNKEERSLTVLLEDYKKPSIMGQYSSFRNKITISADLYKEAQGGEESEGHYSDLLRAMVHEIGHRIHDIHFGYKTVRLPREGRTLYSEKSSRENFAEAFENLVLDKDQARFNKRSEALKKALDKKFIGETKKPLAAKTRPQLRKELLTLTELCETRVHMTTKAARVKLRKSGKFTKGPAGWAWDIETQAEEIEKIARFLLGEDK